MSAREPFARQHGPLASTSATAVIETLRLPEASGRQAEDDRANAAAEPPDLVRADVGAFGAQMALILLGGCMHCWQTFIASNWVALTAGKKLWINVRRSDDPRFSPLFKANTGWPVGQHCDFTASYRDGSRVHVQC